MNSSPIPRNRPGRGRAAASALLLLALAGCSGPKAYYAAAEQRERAAAAQADSVGSANAEAARVSATVQSQATYLKLVAQMQRDGLWYASIAHLDAVEQRWGASPESIRLRADALRHVGQVADSRRQYTLLLATPEAAIGYRGLGLLAGAEGDFAQARELLQQARQRSPTDALLLSDLGYAQMRSGRMDEARLPLMQAMQLQPEQPQVQANVALYLALAGRTEDSEQFMAAHHLSASARSAVRDASQATSQPTSQPAQARTDESTR